MSLRIKILPEHLTNKIAAGEVVERPASVVKELVENALDAGSTEIVIDIEGGGKRLIKVLDNGCGMSREDSLLALERHATSKILVEDDLLSIDTLGFRGEALPSLASVSRFLLASKESAALAGTEIYCEGGRIREVKDRGMASGTLVEVRNLFFNTPARLKFLKSHETEAGHVAEQVTRLALSRPDVRFILASEGKVLVRALDGSLLDRIAAVLGRNVSGDLFPVAGTSDCLQLTGYAARPECSRSGSTHLYTFVNGRFVRDKVFQHGVMQAYRRFLERGRYPVAVLFLTIPPGDVDVNVHPTKHEVRFRHQTEVHDFIASSLESMLQSTPWVRRAHVAEPAHSAPRREPDGVSDRIKETVSSYQPVLPAPVITQPLKIAQRYDSAPEAEHVEPAPPVVSAGFFSSLRVLGCYAGAYLLCQDGDDLILIDQHAAHERILFEQLKVQFASGVVESQGLLFPQVLEFTPAENQLLGIYQDRLEKIGFVLEEFGGGSRKVQAVPRIISAGPWERVLRDILTDLTTLGRSRCFQDIIEDLLMRVACHGVTRGSSLLGTAEISALLAGLDSVGFASNCPHGRPVSHRIRRDDVERMFKRS